MSIEKILVNFGSRIILTIGLTKKYYPY